MSKSLLYRILGIGKIPKEAVAQIQKEGVVLQEEGIGGSVTFRNFRGPGRRHGWKRTWFTGSIVLTREHFLAFAYSRTIIGVSWVDDKFKALKCSLESNDLLCVEFDAATFNDDWSGDMEMRFRTPLAARFVEVINRNAA